MIDSLYYGDHHHHKIENASFEFSTDILATFLRRIYNGFDTSNDFEPTMWREILRIINEATVDGLMRSTYDVSHEAEFLQSLSHSNEVFSAFKVHDMGVDMAKKLKTSDGKLKSFAEWKKDIAPIATHYCGSWLQTEYNTAVLRGHFAAEWKQYEADKDIMPNLRWMPTTSATPDEEHKVYWSNRLTLPVGDKFWNNHHPGDHWNCKCTLEQTDDPCNPEVLGNVPEVKPQPGLKTNPGKSGEMFDDSHPYIADNPKAEAKAVKDVIKEEDSFAPLKTIEEAEDFARKMINESVPGHLRQWMQEPFVNFKNISVESANEVCKALRDMSKYRMAMPRLIVADANYFRDGRAKQANAAHTGDELWLNPKFLKTPQTLAKRKAQIESKWKKIMESGEYAESAKPMMKALEESGRFSASASIREVIIHEMGHHFDDSFLDGMEREMFVAHSANYRDKISAYAAFNAKEYFAESFLSHAIGEKIIDPELAKLFDSYLK